MRKTALFLCAAIACATPSTPFEGHPVLVGIDFVGNHSISAGDLRDHIATQPTSGIFSKTVRYYDADLFAIDLKRIVRFYNQKGFYQARITNVEERTDSDGRVKVVVHIEEGPRAHVQSMQFSGASPLTEDELHDIDDRLPFHVGDPFAEDQYDASKTTMVERLREHGFAEAKVSGSVRIEMDTSGARIVYELQPGQRFKFDDVLVTGNKDISRDPIVFAANIKPGDPFRSSALTLAQQRVYNLGAFAGVRVGFEKVGDSPVAQVRVTVREAPFRTVRFGLGGQIESTRWELPRILAEYTDRNLFGGLRRLELRTTLGYAFVPNIAEAIAGGAGTKKGPVTLTSAQLTNPGVFIPGLDFVTRGEFGREIQPGFSYDQVAARFTLVYRRGSHSVAPGLNFLRYFNSTLDVDLQTLINQAGQSAALLSNCLPSCTLSYANLRYTYDSRDNLLEPTDGLFATVEFQQTIKPGSFYYFRLEPEVRTYVPLSKYGILAFRMQYGALILEGPNTGAQESPFTQRFFGGGLSYQRGYAPLQQGPKLGANINLTTALYQDWVPIGGNGAMLLSAEARLRTDFILRNTMFVLFTDASRITPNPSVPWKGGLEVSPGIGLRYLTPFGPVRVDIGYRVNPTTTTLPASKLSDGRVVPATVVATSCSDQPAPCLFQRRWAYHITLGEAF